MEILWIVSGVFVLVGFVTIGVNALPGVSVGFSVRRNVDGHVWGCQLFGAGTLLSVVLWLFSQTPWPDVHSAARVAVVLAGCWVLAAVWLWAVVLFTRVQSTGHQGSRLHFLPAPGAKAAEWSPAYWFFVVVGLLEVLVLACFVFLAK